jgi:hypothetical protein
MIFESGKEIYGVTIMNVKRVTESGNGVSEYPTRIYITKFDALDLSRDYNCSKLTITCSGVTYLIKIEDLKGAEILFNILIKTEERNSKIEETLS